MTDPGSSEKSEAVEEVELSLISDDPVVAANSYRPRDEESELAKQPDNPVELMSSFPRDKLLCMMSCCPREEKVELLNEYQGTSEKEGSVFPKEGSLLPEPAVEACIASADVDVVEGELPICFEPEDEHAGIHASSQQLQAKKIEKELDDILRKGDFDAIYQKVTPKTLASCERNTLLKAFQVNKVLRDLADDGNSEKGDIEKLEKSMNEFTSTLMDPLKADADTRNTFQSCFDYVIDKAIDTNQKKFISHPVVYNLVKSRWYRTFFSARRESWLKPRRWGYFLLNLWTVFDIVFFPFLFAIFFVMHLIKQVLRKRREIDMCFVLTLGKDTSEKDTSEKEFNLINGTMSHIVKKYGVRPANYCVVLHEENQLIGNIIFGKKWSSEDELLNKIKALKQPSSPSSLCEDLEAACTAFKSQNVRKEAKKVVVLFLNDSLPTVTAKTENLKRVQKKIRDMQVNIVPVGVGDYAKLSELKVIATNDGTARRFGEYESPETLGTAVIQEKYKDYFTTPYFIFFRDMLSYLTLVGLHFAICLSPSTVSFSRLEWAILVFFLGRIFMEVDQFISAKKAGVKARKMLNKESDEPNNEGSEENETSNDNIWPEKFTRYFSDRWNVLDCIIDLFYLISFILRILTSRNSTDVADNRLLAVSEYFYGFIAMFLTIRAFGQVMECMQGLGAIQIALFFFIWDVIVIFWQFLATVLAFSMAMTKVFVAEKSYTSGKDSAEDLACSDSGIICWWNMATHLCWSLLSLADLDKLNSVDNPSISLIYLLYSFFLITGVILLVNMMIALLTNTYQRVQDNSLQEWSFRRATTVRTYSTYHPIPVPFNLLTVPLMLLWRTQFDTPALDEEVRSRALDKLVVKLQRIYFEKYGYKFPLTEEKKIDHLVQENEGSRKMINQIAQQVFRPRGNKKEQLAFGERAWYDSPGIAVDGCLLTYMGPDFCVICREGRPKHIHSAKFKSPFTPKTPRFEVLIQETGEKRIIGLGVVGESYDCHSMPGWYDGTVGYHADDGKIFETGFSELGREVEGIGYSDDRFILVLSRGAMAYRGDLLACEVDFNGVFEDKKISVSFFLNGREVNSSSMKYTSGKQLFPLVALGFKGITVLTKMCHRDRDCFSRVTNEDLQEQLDEQRRIMSELRNLALRLEKKEEPFDRKLN